VISPAFRKARPGDLVELFATGLAASPAGVLVGFQPLTGVTVKLGDTTIPASAAGLVSPGEFQINFTIPKDFANLPEGDYPITVQVNGVYSPAKINSEPQDGLVLPIVH